MVDTLDVLVEGGNATPGPPLGPVLGPLGVNVVAVVSKINQETKGFHGMKVPVKIIVEKDKSFRIVVGLPPTSALILRELGIEKGSGKPSTEKVGNLSISQIKKIVEMKRQDILASDIKKSISEVLGTCVSMGITVEGRDPREIQRDIKEGKFNLE